MFAISLALGMVAVVWHARANANAERARAQTEVMGCGAALELQFSRALRAADVLGALARQSGGAIPNFQRIAGGLYVDFPELASLEQQPGGVVSEIVPRANSERAIGLNVFKHPAYGASATAALQNRTATVAAPLILYGGEPGLIVRVPVFQTGRDNPFWGFVAVSMRLAEALDRAGLSELSNKGYDYAFYVADSAPGKSVTIARHGIETLRDTVRQPIRVQNLEFHLALRRHGGWFSKSLVLMESAAVVVASGVLFFLVSLAAGRRELEQSLAQAQRQLAAESTERNQAQQALNNLRANAQTELKQAQAALQQVQSETGGQAQALQAATEGREAAEAALKQAQLNASELQERLDRTVQSGKDAWEAARAELTGAQTKLKAAELRARELEAAAAKAQQAREAATGTLQTQHAKAQATIADLLKQLNIQKLAAEEAAEADAVRLKESGEAIHDLRARLTTTQARVAELELQLQAREASPPSPAPEPELIPVAVPEPPASRASVESQDATSPLPGAYLEAVRRKRTRRKDQNQIELFGAADLEATPKEPAAEDSRVVATTQPAVIEPSAEVALKQELEAEIPAVVDEESPETGPAADWPEIDGISAAEARSHWQGDARLYGNALRHFADEQAKAPEEIRDALLQGDLSGAARCVQVLQTAGTQVGATEVVSAAAALAKALQDHSDPMDIEFEWAELDNILRHLINGIKAEVHSKEEKPAAARKSAPPREVDVPQLRRAVSQILPLLSDQDPGAKDCLKANRALFRSAFPAAGFEEFEHLVKSNACEPALERLTKAVKKHGISI